jgi:hypothetical protein
VLVFAQSCEGLLFTRLDQVERAETAGPGEILLAD